MISISLWRLDGSGILRVPPPPDMPGLRHLIIGLTPSGPGENRTRFRDPPFVGLSHVENLYRPLSGRQKSRTPCTRHASLSRGARYHKRFAFQVLFVFLFVTAPTNPRRAHKPRAILTVVRFNPSCCRFLRMEDGCTVRSWNEILAIFPKEIAKR